MRGVNILKKCFIFGTNTIARLLYYWLNCEGKKIDGFVVNENYVSNCDYDLPDKLSSIEEIIDKYGWNNVEVYLSIGYTNMNNIREKTFNWLQEKNINVLNYIHPTAVIADNIKMGVGNIIMERAVIQPFYTMGNANVVWSGAILSHDGSLGNFNSISANSTISGNVKIHNKCFLGSNCTIKDSVEIFDEAFIGAGAFVSDNMDQRSVIVPKKGSILKEASLHIGV